ncbi:uncharacterized protein [Antedon mediterranea]
MEAQDDPAQASSTSNTMDSSGEASDPLSTSMDSAACEPRDSDVTTDFLSFSTEMLTYEHQFPQNFDTGHANSPNYPDYSGIEDSYDCDTRDPNSKKGVCGLRNIGNTCFMNTGLQCLMNISHLCKFILEHDEFQEATLARKFSDLMKKIWSGEFSVLKPLMFKNALSDMHSQFRGFRQHDGQEFLALLLDTLHEELNQANVVHKSISPVEDVSEESCDSQNVSEASTSKLSELEALDIDSGKEEATCSNNLVATDQTKAVLQKHENAEKIQTLEDFYMKDVKTLNTNVLTEESMPVTTDSEKFPKSPGSRGRRPEYQSSVEHVTEGNNRVKTREKRTNVLADMNSQKDVIHENSQGTKLQLDETNSCMDVDTRKRMKMDDCSKPEYIKDFSKYNAIPDSSSEYSVYSVMNTTQKNFDQITSEKLCSKLMFSEALKCDMTKQSKYEDEAKQLNTSKEKLVNVLHNVDIVTESCVDENLPTEKVALTFERRSSEDVCGNMVTSSSDDFGATTDDSSSCQLSEASVSSDNMSQQSFLPNNRNVWKNDGGDALKSKDVGAGSESNPLPLDPEAEADREWAKYIKQNKSVITETFQGQFKSTVVCNVCNHVSVTYEPFMYLSVPLPRAMEKQLVVTFVPIDKYPPTRFLVTLNRQDLVANLRQIVGAAFLKENPIEATEILLAEVLDNHISRFLDDGIQISYINDSCRLLYAIETESKQSIEQRYLLDASSDIPSEFRTDATSRSEEEEKVYMSLTNVEILQSMEHDVEENMVNPQVISSADNVISCDKVSSSNSLLTETGSHSPTEEMINSASMNCDGFAATSLDPTSSGQQLNNQVGDRIVDIPHPFDGVINNHGVLPDKLDNIGNLESYRCLEEADKLYPLTPSNGDQSSTGAPISVGWKPCVICLDDFPESELLLHTVCQGVLCHTCRERVTAHCGFEAMKCPVCSQEIDPIVDYVPVVSSCRTVVINKRILLLPIQFQFLYEEDSIQKACLFGHPRAMYIPNEIDAEMLYRRIQDMLLVDAPFKLILSDGQGYQCSRCSYDVHCRGCEISCEGVITLQSSDTIMVVFDNLLPEQIEITSACHEDPMLTDLRQDDSISLKQCFEAFSKSEYLDEHNPWFCPCCRKPQCASKTLSICRYPNVLIVYLKRFVFHNLMSTKLENNVLFPVEDLNVSSYLCPAISADKAQLLYDLQGCVCHFGGVNAGHYTSYVKNPLTQEWYYCNDETVQEQTPTEKDAASIYILFYCRKGSNVDFKFPTSLQEIETITSTTSTSGITSRDMPSDSGDMASDHKKTTMNIDENMTMLYNSDLDDLLKELQNRKEKNENEEDMKEDFYQ